MPRKSTGEYPPDWKEIATNCKLEADGKCIRCGHEHDPASGYTLTVHHMDMNPANNVWWNLLALCQRCHLTIQSKVVLEQGFMFRIGEWLEVYVAGYYAKQGGSDNHVDREQIEADKYKILALHIPAYQRGRR